ncbi:MAG: hypothetical protein GVY36_20025 [Verrucomicrobia bacterium]|nr:hypothetical protein [Verrucomicrobiota bacterium]
MARKNFHPHVGTGRRDTELHRKSLGRLAQRAKALRTMWAGRRLRPFSVHGDHAGRSASLVTMKNGGSLDMASQLKKAQPSLVKDGNPSRKASDGSATKSLHLVLDKPSYARLVWLQGALRAASFVEVLRRALDAYEIFDPEGLAMEDGVDTDRAKSPATKADVKHLYIDISPEMKKQLDDEKSAHGRAYKVTINRALCVLTQLVRNRTKLVEAVKKGGENADEDYDHTLDDAHPELLASL